MLDELPATEPVIRIATPSDIDIINELDSYSTSPNRNIHREMEKYFGSVDPSTHDRTLIFLLEIEGKAAAKAELMLPPRDSTLSVGYIKRVVVNPEYRKMGLARKLLEHIISWAQNEYPLSALDLHVWEQNTPAIRLYEALGFQLQHRELYFRLLL
ncbi:MAG TPA: GNAT family N-acetyltransferase [Ktedonobacteraceae bacterium]|jgi:ribosomal protein S18 acetylase RimI-like enzyme|nr:GNAT family N-acetyltransferase [Ktedonobacteraceae bacterium]